MSKARELSELADSITVDGSGNVDVTGTVTADGLTVDGSATIGTDTGGIFNLKGGSTTSPQLRFFDGGTARARIGVPTGQTYLSLSGSDTLTADVAINSSGNVGIGTSSPSAVLHVSSSNPQIRLQDSDGSGIAATPYMGFYDSSSRLGYFGYGGGAESDFYIHNEQSANIRFYTGASERLRIDSSGKVGIGTSSPAYTLDVLGNAMRIQASSISNYAKLGFTNASGATPAWIGIDGDQTNSLSFHVGSNIGASTDLERMRISSAGDVGISQTNPIYSLHISDAGYTASDGSAGFSVDEAGTMLWQTANSAQARINDSSTGTGTHNYLLFYYQGGAIGDIDTLDNSTIRYNTFTGAHWSQTDEAGDILVGTVMSTIDEQLEWTNFEFTTADGETEKTSMAGNSYTIGETYSIPVDEDGGMVDAVATGYETANRLMRVKVSDVEGDPAVYGVYAGKYADGDISIEALGAGIIRIGSGVSVNRGDLLMSAGDGTAKPQDDDIVRSKTIAKVTGNLALETYADGSYTVPCVLMAG